MASANCRAAARASSCGIGPCVMRFGRTETGVEAADDGLLAPELAAGISRVKGAKSKGRLIPHTGMSTLWGE